MLKVRVRRFDPLAATVNDVMIPRIFFLLSEHYLRQDAIPFSPYELFRALFTELMSMIVESFA